VSFTARPPPLVRPTRGVLEPSVLRCVFRKSFVVTERPHPPPAHVICGGGRALGRILYVPPQNLGIEAVYILCSRKEHLVIEEDCRNHGSPLLRVLFASAVSLVPGSVETFVIFSTSASTIGSSPVHTYLPAGRRQAGRSKANKI